MTQKYVAILTGPDTYLDHLAPICFCMQMPLIITEMQTYEIAKEYYPQIEIIYRGLKDLSLDYIGSNFDVIFESGKFWMAELEPFFSLTCQKKMRFVFCPHWNSDKGHSTQKQIKQDISLVYGNHMLDLLSKVGAISHIQATVRTGNYRLPFYQMHQNFYDFLAQKRLKPFLDPNKKTILYAPTWQDGENPSSFFTSTEVLIKELKENFNIVVKLHPFLEEFHPAHTYHVLSKYEGIQGVVFLQNFPAIYALLQICDIYVGDYSSIGYDFLAFDKPMYFLPGKQKTFSLLHDCGLEILEQEGIRDFILGTLETNQKERKNQRHKMYDYAFGLDKSFTQIHQEIVSILA